MGHRRGTSRSAAAPFLGVALAFGLGACAATPAATPTVAPSVAPTTIVTPAPIATAPPATVLPTPAETRLSSTQACSASSLKASHDLVEGAAGSRITTVLLETVVPCSIDLYPALGLRDANGTELVGGAAGGAGRIDIGPNVSYTTAVRFANWCNPDPRFPLSLVILIGAEELEVTGSSFPDEGEMPPCNGGGGPVLEAGAWEATP